jgi:ATP-dependent Clp protease ATP-binding subunit ClpA
VLVALLQGEGPVRRALEDSGADAAGLLSRALAELRADGLDGDALATLGIDLDAVRRQADAVFGRDALERPRRSPRGHIPFTPNAKKALELALREAIRLQHRSIRSEHLMLGLLRADNPGRTLLLHAGVDADALRRALEDRARAA